MLVQVTAYEVLGSLVVQCTTAETTESSWHWEHRVLEQVDTGRFEASAWDLIWLVGQTLQDHALRRSERAPVPTPQN